MVAAMIVAVSCHSLFKNNEAWMEPRFPRIALLDEKMTAYIFKVEHARGPRSWTAESHFHE